MTGYERALLYRLAAESGLRANELRSLKVSSFHFKNLTVSTTRTKNKKAAVLPLRGDTAAELGTYLAGKTPSATAFGGSYRKTDRTAEMLRKDLAEAGLDYSDGCGRYFDFHALRGECATLLAASGVHPKTAQSILRHSDIKLTMNAYTHTLRGQEAEAVQSLPDLSLPSEASQKATGTDNLAVDSAYKPAYKKLTKNAYSDRIRSSANDTFESQKKCSDEQSSDAGKVLSDEQLDNQRDSLSLSGKGQDTNGRCRTRTCDRLIKSQLLYQLS